MQSLSALIVTSRRLALALVLALCASAAHAQATAHAQPAAAPFRIGIIGTGRIGGALAGYWVRSGHEVMISSRHPQELEPLAARLGPRAHVGTPREAAAFGSVVLVSVPYGAMPQLGADLGRELAGKVILDTSNPIERRDGPMAIDAQKKGAGVATAEYLRSKRVVRAFNCIPAATLANESDRRPERIAIPIGGDDPKAVQVAAQLVREAGFDPVVVGSLAATRQFDLGQPLASGSLSGLTAAELTRRLHH